jgi:hypothetical protein
MLHLLTLLLQGVLIVFGSIGAYVVAGWLWREWRAGHFYPCKCQGTQVSRFEVLALMDGSMHSRNVCVEGRR